MKFSVLMSLYIKENPQYLRECFESLVAQTHPADEIVLVFDGAVTPELEAVVSEFETKLPLSLVKLPKNLGLGKALNEGLKHCSHDWVFRMDTDDICVPERFANKWRLLSNIRIQLFSVGRLLSLAKIFKISWHIVMYRLKHKISLNLPKNVAHLIT